jgi:hypothetical protein
MELLWINYTKKDGNQHYLLFLPLGNKPGKLCGLIADKIPDGVKKKIVVNLSELSLEARLRWLKSNYPTIMDTGYRELISQRALIMRTYSIDPLKMS